jgi:hypothetical protein
VRLKYSAEITKIAAYTRFLSEDVVELVGFDASFDPLAALSATSQGTELDLGGGNSVLLLGRTVAEFSADDFLIA